MHKFDIQFSISLVGLLIIILSSFFVGHDAMGDCGKPPVASANYNQEVDQGTKVMLDGSKSRGCAALPLSYTWKYTTIDGPAVHLKDSHKAIAKFVAPEVSDPTTLTFKLSVKYDLRKVIIGDSNNNGSSTTGIDTSSSTEVDVLVRPITDRGEPTPAGTVPFADADEGGRYNERTKDIPLDGSKSYDLDGDNLVYKWKKIRGPKVVIDDPSAAVTSFDAPSVKKDASVRLMLEVSDKKDGSDTAFVDFKILDTRARSTDPGGQPGTPSGGQSNPVSFNQLINPIRQQSFNLQSNQNTPPFLLVAILALAILVIIVIAVKKSRGKPRRRSPSLNVLMKGGLSP